MQNNYFKIKFILLFVATIFLLSGCETKEVIETTNSKVSKETVENSVKMVELSASQKEKITTGGYYNTSA